MTRPASIGKSYLELCFHVDGGDNLYLRIPTVWNDVKKIWICFIKTPKTKKLIHVEGKKSFDLQNAMNKELSSIFEKKDDFSKEVFEMFQPLSYWSEMNTYEE